MSNTYKVLITDHRFPDVSIQKEIISRFGAELIVGHVNKENDIIKLAKDVHGILNARAKITGRVINSLRNCKIIVRYGVGVDTVDIPAATRKGIMVANVTDFCIDEVSDHALALLLSLSRKVVLSARKVRAQKWDLAELKPIRRLKDQVIGLIGYGRIGSALARKAKPIGFRVIAYDPYIAKAGEEKDGVMFLSLDSVLKESDYVSVHAPLTSETRGMIGENELNIMKPSAFLINVSRGPLIDEDALIKALQDKCIAGAGLDVMCQEPPEPDNPLLQIDEVVVTSHVAFYSEEAQQELQQKAAQNLVTALSGEVPDSIVNPEVLRQV